MSNRIFSRRDFIRSATTGVGGVSLLAGFALQQPASSQQASSPSGLARRAFDPLLDPRCRKLPVPPGSAWQAQWIWYPGQLASHLQAKGVQAAMRRCTSVGYPGTFRQPLTQVYLRTQATLENRQTLRWTGPVSRIRVLVNGNEGDITNRSRTVDAGPVELLVLIDFAEGLPCLLLEGGPLSTGLKWQASLDRQQWVAVEAEPVLRDPNFLPDTLQEWTVEIPPDQTTTAVKVSESGSTYHFQPGGDLILDFHHDELGRLAFDARGAGKLTIVVGESLAEVQNLNAQYFEQEALPALEMTAQEKPVLLPERCLRFARFLSSGDCEVKQVHFQARVSPLEYKGGFECSDSMLNDIWAAGAATLHACAHAFYLDGIRRDALSWHDGLIALEAGDMVFYDTALARQTIISQSLPPNPTVKDLGIADAPLYALTAFENDYLARGELEFSRRYQERIHDTLRFFLSLQDERGFVSGRDAQPYGFFPDWAVSAATGPDSHGTPAYAQMLLMRAFEIGAAFSRRWEDPMQASRYAALAGKLRQNIRQHFWNKKEGAYVNGFDQQGSLDEQFTCYAQTNAILFDLASPPEWELMFKKVLDNPARRSSNWSIGQQWELLAYAKAGRIEALLERLKLLWGGILKQGYTRFWEDIRPNDDALQQLRMYGKPYSNSLCHGWAGAAPILGLVRGFLGIWPTQPGYAECDVRPHLNSLEWLRGSLPTPSGSIVLELDQRKGGQLTLPPTITAHLAGYTDEAGRTVLRGPGTFRLLKA